MEATTEAKNKLTTKKLFYKITKCPDFIGICYHNHKVKVYQYESILS